MKVTEMKVDCLQIKEIVGLDPVTAYFHDGEPGTGYTTITCYGTAWTAYWGAMGKGYTVRKFVAQAGVDYLCSCFLRSDIARGKPTKRERDYLERVLGALKTALEVPS